MDRTEKRLQRTIVQWLKSRGCFVITVTTVPGVPTGTPDVIALMPNHKWAALEVKRSEHAPFQPLQKLTVAMLDEKGYSRVVWPENWATIRVELDAILNM